MYGPRGTSGRAATVDVTLSKYPRIKADHSGLASVGEGRGVWGASVGEGRGVWGQSICLGFLRRGYTSIP